METHGSEKKSPLLHGTAASAPTFTPVPPPRKIEKKAAEEGWGGFHTKPKRDAAGTMLSSFHGFILGGCYRGLNASREARGAKTARANPPPARDVGSQEKSRETSPAQQQSSGETATPANSSPGGWEQQRCAPAASPKRGAEANQCAPPPPRTPPARCRKSLCELSGQARPIMFFAPSLARCFLKAAPPPTVRS